MRRLALVALAGVLACEETAELGPGPRDAFYFPVGLGVLDRRLLVVSSNADLGYEADAGGSVIAANVCEASDASCETDTVASGLNVQSFAGELGVADPAACPALEADAPAAAIVPVRGTNLVYRLAVGALGELSCDACDLPVGSADRGDPFSVGIACDTATTPGGPTVARAYVGYLRSSVGQGWLTQIDLLRQPSDALHVQHQAYDFGQVRAFAYDSSRKRLYFTRTTVGAGVTLRYVDLANDCRLDLYSTQGGCRSDQTRGGAVPLGIELRGIALSNETDNAARVRRAYLTARIYDSDAAASAGARVGDFDGLLLVVELGEDAAGKLDFRIVDQIPIGYGAGDVRVLPRRDGKRDVVAALAQDDGVLWIYDDETGGRVAIGRDPVTGAPLVGRGPFGLAVDPVPFGRVAGGTDGVARVYVGSFRESFVTPIDVPLDAPETAGPLISGGAIRRIGPQVTP